MTREQILRGLLEAEHAAVYAYAVIGARLDDKHRRLALTAYEAHRATRDELVLLVPGVGPASTYDVRTDTPAEAIGLATQIEDDLATRWRDLVGADRALRPRAIQGLQDSAVRAARWRQTGGFTPLTTPFPGE